MKKPIDELLDALEWKKVEPPEEVDELPYATHEGILKLGDQEFRVSKLSNGQRVMNIEDLKNWFKV